VNEKPLGASPVVAGGAAKLNGFGASVDAAGLAVGKENKFACWGGAVGLDSDPSLVLGNDPNENSLGASEAGAAGIAGGRTRLKAEPNVDGLAEELLTLLATPLASTTTGLVDMEESSRSSAVIAELLAGVVLIGLGSGRLGAGADGGMMGVMVKAALIEDSVGVVDITSLPESGTSAFSFTGVIFIG
jgi:hypothetical protein